MLIKELLAEAKVPTVDALIDMFAGINADCKKTGETVVELTDADYYEDQIHNLYSDSGVSAARAAKLAKEMAAKATELIAAGTIDKFGKKKK